MFRIFKTKFKEFKIHTNEYVLRPLQCFNLIAKESSDDDAIREKYTTGDSGSLNANNCDPNPHTPRRSRQLFKIH